MGYDTGMFWSTKGIRTRDNLLFFPTYAHRSANRKDWQIDVRGWVFVPKDRSLVRRAFLRLLRRGLQLSKTDAQSAVLKERMRAFLVDNKRRKRVVIRIGETVHELPISRPNGHFEHTLAVPVEQIELLRNGRADGLNWLPYDVVLGSGDARVFQGRFETIDEQGISVVTDIDDTIKITNVADRRELLFNTFLREFKSVPGMSNVFRRWADHGASFHYVSSSPWQLFEPLQKLLTGDHFPVGSFHLREFRLKDRGTLEHLSGSEPEKRAIIEKILAAFPGRRFVYFGDSGERDPEMYGDLARRFPKQTLKIFIRNANRESPSSERMKQAFRDMPNDQWSLFDDAAELAERTEPQLNAESRG